MVAINGKEYQGNKILHLEQSTDAKISIDIQIAGESRHIDWECGDNQIKNFRLKIGT